jgi:dissimilatory sulfite reductase related protein
MPKIELAGRMYELNENGFLQKPSDWSKEVAAAMALRDGTKELNASHWKVIDYLRDYYAANGICPMVRRLVKDCGFSLRQLYDLFPEGPANSACKWAGMPRATGCSV